MSGLPEIPPDPTPEELEKLEAQRDMLFAALIGVADRVIAVGREHGLSHCTKTEETELLDQKWELSATFHQSGQGVSLTAAPADVGKLGRMGFLLIGAPGEKWYVPIHLIHRARDVLTPVIDGNVDEPDFHDVGWRLYLLLALFDRRGGALIDDLVRAAREGYERSGMEGINAWEEFDRLWLSTHAGERQALVDMVWNRP